MKNLMTGLYVKATNAVYAFKQDQRGVTAIEYAVLAAAIVAVVAIVGSSIENGVNDAVDSLDNAISNATS